ncbi:MAG: hypothetical protein JXQ90_02605 [Cyclobacteriaceae bacterium]
MKKIFQKLLLLAVVGSVGFLYSCGEDPIEETFDPPSVTFAGLDEGAEVEFGTDVELTLTVSAPGGFNVVRLSDGTNQVAEFTRTDLGVDAGTTSATTPAITLTELAVGSYMLTAEAVDDDGQTGEATLTFSVTSPPAKIQTAVLLYAPTADETSQTFYSISENKTYSVNDVEATSDPVSANIDLGYFFVTEANIAAPSAYSTAFTGAYDISDWGTRNETYFVAVSATPTELVTVADVQAVLDGVDFSGGNLIEEGLETGTVLAFSTDGGQQGILHVTALQPGFNSTDFITLEFILAEAGE